VPKTLNLNAQTTRRIRPPEKGGGRSSGAPSTLLPKMHKALR
jgi:hypothetical protein